MPRDIVTFILFNSEKKILLQHRSSSKAEDPHKWGFFGGGIEENETPLEAVKRESFEELDYKLNNPKLVYQTILNGYNLYVFIEKFDPKKNIELLDGGSMRWLSYDELDDLDLIESNLEILKAIWGQINNEPRNNL